ncbi:MAG TPA: S16 family serine protease [Nocardioidaceae bacterium]|nr:S16 family serine protease [Nocardioidaceae bacterium]
MTRRTVSSILACVLLVMLFGAAAFLPVPYVTMSPGPTIDVLGERQGEPIVEVDGHKTYPTEGDLRLVTVSVTGPGQELSLAEALMAWFDNTRAVYPRDVVYEPEKTEQEERQESSVQMVSSQDTAVAAALTELGYDLPVVTEVLAVSDGSPAQGKLQTRDKIVSVNGTKINNATEVSKAIQKTGAGEPATFVVRRSGATKTLTVTPQPAKDDPDKAVVGVVVGEGYQFPFDVSVNISDDIGGPSAGLIFSLAIYDALTPGSLVDGNDIAGTGTISADGSVGPIGGIQQKIVAAADAGAKVFLVPPDNCDSALGAHVDDEEIRLVKATSMESALRSIRAYDKDENADLPGCG